MCDIHLSCPFSLIYSFTLVLGLLSLRAAFLSLQGAGAPLGFGSLASHLDGFSRCWAQALRAKGLQQLWLLGSKAQAQQLRHTGSVAMQHVRSSWTMDWTHVPCTGRHILLFFFWIIYSFLAVLVLHCCGTLSLVVGSGGRSSLWCLRPSLQWLVERSTGSRLTGFNSCSTWGQ